jgi:hypothetical protein
MTENNNIPYDSGLLTKIWGPHMWVALHSITFCYPNNPTIQDKNNYKKFFELIGDVLPCLYCKKSYKKFILEGNTKLDDNVLENRYNLTKWFYYIHEAVNNKLGVDYGVSYDDVVNRYESYRADCFHNKQTSNDDIKGCDANIDKKTISYQIDNIKECPIISEKTAKHFINYAKMRGLSDNEFNLINNFSNDLTKDKKLWNIRNNECNEIFKNMKLNGIKSIEIDGQWKDLPTIEELKLIMRLSSNLSNAKLIELIKTLPDCKCEYKKIYKLVKN